MRFIILSLLALAAPLFGSSLKTYTMAEALAAIRQVETGGEPDGGIGAVGDNGAAVGPLQIHLAYHFDAAERDSSLKNYKDCLTSLDYSERVVRAYMGRYAKAEAKRLRSGLGTLADVEKVARIHNGGPKGHRKKATVGYWRKVEAQL